MTRFKENVMKECRELFLDEEFANKVDENKNLIAFSNGVFDTLTFEFRDGKPEDYISFCTNLEFHPDRPHDSYPCWQELNKFIQDVLPDPDVCVSSSHTCRRLYADITRHRSSTSSPAPAPMASRC
jgi:phage/plasmid-associated DNA primase